MNKQERVREAEGWLEERGRKNYEDRVLGEVEWQKAHDAFLRAPLHQKFLNIITLGNKGIN